MTLWGINLDGVALINLIMCIGFSVDFSAHICYHYMTAEEEGGGISHSSSRIRGSLYALGLPIIQGAASTILGVFGLAFANCYLFVTFFKMIFLVIVLGALHGLVLLPVLLSIFGPDQCRGLTTCDKKNGKSKKLQSYESSAISTPTITTFSKRMIPNNNSSFHVNHMYNGMLIGGGGVSTNQMMKNNLVVQSQLQQHQNHNFGQNHSVYESDEHDGIESICSCTINMGYRNDQNEHALDNVNSMTYEYYDGRENRVKYFTSPQNTYNVNILRNHKKSMPSAVFTTETSTEQSSSPSTLSTSSNSGRRIPRAHRKVQPRAKITGGYGSKYRQQRHPTPKLTPLNVHHNEAIMTLKNGVVLSPSQLMVLKEGKDNTTAQLTTFSNATENANNQLAVVVVENSAPSNNKTNTDMKPNYSNKSCNNGSETTSPALSTSTSSSSSPSNIRCNSQSKPNNKTQYENWDDKLHR